MQAYRLLLFALLFSGLGIITGCSDSKTANTHINEPVAITQGDECHVCGMLIANAPGPKGEAFERGGSTPRKFCSTRDLFAYLLQPENATIVREIYVHDMADTDWHKPGDIPRVDGRKAWYVAGQPLGGAMGPTLASFAKREAAEAFIAQYGGRLLRYNEITLELISKLDFGQETKAGHSGTH